jgi:lipopolysaccharide/colanic/teichoic acid biosynthesis glycosyltransferase
MNDQPSAVVAFRGRDQPNDEFVPTAQPDSLAIPQRSPERSYDPVAKPAFDLPERSYDPVPKPAFDLPGRSYDPVAKRVFDLAASVFLLLLLLPGLLLIAFAIKLTSRGPVLFRQPRYGLHSQLFGIYKFRTMYVDRADPTGVNQTRRSDPRITPLGKFLRKSNLDEVPQLLNVVMGDMSLVGPRPHVPGMLAGGVLYEQLVPDYFERHKVRPGITGLAQVKGLRGSTEDSKRAIARIGHDLSYIENWSFALDCRILIETVWTELIAGGNGI